jgi:hypothetical protein
MTVKRGRNYGFHQFNFKKCGLLSSLLSVLHHCLTSVGHTLCLHVVQLAIHYTSILLSVKCQGTEENNEKP